MARSPHKGAEPAWSRQDEVLYRTCVVWSKLRAGEGAEPVYPGWSAIAHHGDNEIAFAAGQAAFYAWLPGGDGSYVRQRNVYMG